MIIYRCGICKEVKEKEDFARRNERPERVRTGRQSACIKCNTSKITPEMNRRSSKKYKDNLRNLVYAHYSEGLMKCNCCGESTYRFLTLDHIEGGGNEHRKQVGGSVAVLKDIVKNDYPEGYQVLCFNCNCGRAYNNGVCPHEEM